MAWFKFLDPENDINFMGYRKYFLGLSLTLAVVSAIAFFNPGPRFGTDFVGGTEVEVAFTKPVDAGQPLRYADVDVDETVEAVRIRRELERGLGGGAL